MKVKKSYLGAGAVAIGAVLAFAVPAGAAVNLQSESAADSIIKIGKNAQLKAHGAATVVTVNITCPVGYTASPEVYVTQTVGSVTTGGSRSPGWQPCTGSVMKLKIAVTASPKPFKSGVAYAVADVSVSNAFDFAFKSTSREIINIA